LVLSRPDIIEVIRDGRVRIEPAVPEKGVAQVSIDLTLGRGRAPYGFESRWLQS
jgi:hypothetical protein